ncbi:AAA family ATPase [Pantoea vagans]|uniref:AAA family ATPase n=1 Tax=Pantoea vagans TaxID=470934 RepID=UPI00320B3DAD
MFSGIQKIISTDDFSGIIDDITLNGRNLIITGGNGCGKTRFVKKLFEILFSRVAERNYVTDEDLDAQIINAEYQIENSQIGTQNWSYFNTTLPNLIAEKNNRKKFSISFKDNDQGLFAASYHSGQSVLMNFPAFRSANINPINAIRSLESIKTSAKEIAINSHQIINGKAAYFEEYLVALKQARALYITEDNDHERASKIEEWFNKLESDLGNLFEDESLRLNFIIKSSSFEINQSNKEPYKLQNLSSGFSAVMCIYAELLMNIEANEISPDELRGIVFIDEIDAHLHISIQKKIMGFLTKSFPLIQFIVTTHSPFVVMSVDNAVIYDLSKHEQVNDLSMYSYNSVAKSLFDTLPLSSMLFEKINKLYALSLNKNRTTEEDFEVDALLEEIYPHFEQLDTESQFFYNFSKVEILKGKRRD